MANLDLLSRARIDVRPNSPIELSEYAHDAASCPPEDRGKLARLNATLTSYRRAAQELLGGKYARFAASVSPHLTDSCRPQAFLFPDGILIRYDRRQFPGQKGFVGIFEDQTLTSLAAPLSDGFLHCPLEAKGFDPGDNAPTIALFAQQRDMKEHELAKRRVFAVVQRSTMPTSDTVGRRPTPWMTVRNSFDVNLEGEIGPPNKTSQAFLLRTRIALPVAWETIQIFPPFDEESWDPTSAPYWAENDILADIVRRNVLENKFRSLDPYASARKCAVKLLADFESLLEGPEEPIHQYVKSNPQLLNPMHTRMWSKLPLGSSVTDFVFAEPSGEYLLVELEKPSHSLFGKSGHPLAELNHALNQIMDWRRYLEDNLTTSQRELGLDGITSKPQALVVIGRSKSLSEANRRNLVAMQTERQKIKIITYDDLLAEARSTFENMLGLLWDAGPGVEIYLRRK